MTRGSVLCLALLAVLMVGCGADDDDRVAASSGEEVSSAPTQASTDLEMANDPVEGAFSVGVPRGWYNRAYSTRIHTIIHDVVICVSPNSDTVLFLGDPHITQYWNPQTANEFTRLMVQNNPAMKLESVRASDEFFTEYAAAKFGHLEGFKAEAPVASPDVEQQVQELLAQHSMQANVDVVEIPFTYQEKGRAISALLIGQILDFGPFWIPNVAGISTTGNATDFRAMLLAIGKSKKTNPEWQAKQQALHEQRMAEIRQQGQRNMDWIQASAQRHQARMKALWAANDAGVRNFYERSAASDRQHQGFINSINGEHTVVNSSGKTWQVDNSYDKYYVNKSDNSYIGGDVRLDADEIRRRGLNPDDYEEVKIRN